MKLIKSIFTLLLFLLCVSSIFGQDYSKQRKEAEDKFNEGKIEEAIAISEKIVASAEKKSGKDHPDYAKSLQDLGVYHFLNYNNATALTLLEQALTIYTKNPGNKSNEYALCLADYGGVLYSGGEYIKAEKALAECQQVFTLLKKNEEVDFGIILNNLAEIKRALGKMEEAEKLYMETQRIFEKLNLQATVEYASLMNNLANLYHDQYDYTKAEKYYTSSLEVYKTAVGIDAPEYTNVAKSYALLLADIGKYEEARIGIEEVVKKYESSMGKTSIEYAASINDLANIYDKGGNYKIAETYYMQAKELKEASVGTSSPSYWTTLNNLAMLYGKLGNYEKGLGYINTVLSSMKEAGSEKTPSYANYLNNAASLYYQGEDDKKAELKYNESLAIIKELFGEEHPDYSRVLNNLALIYSRQKEYKKAEEYYLKSLRILQKDPLNNTIEIAATNSNLGELYSSTKNYAMAEPLMVLALTSYQNMFSENHPDYAKTYSNLGLLYFRSGNYTKAKETITKAQDLIIKLMYNDFSFLTENEKMLYWHRAQSQFEFYNAFCLKAYKQFPSLASQMFNYTLETKSLILHHSNLIKKKINESGKKDLIEKFKTWEEKREKLAGYYNLKKSELKKNNIDILSLENEVHLLEKELTISSGEFADFRSEKKKTWKDVQNKLKANEAAVEILRIQSFDQNWTDSICYVALIVTKETVENPILVLLPDGKKLEKKFFKSYANAIKFDKLGTEHYDAYWKEIDKHLSGKEVIYLSPSGIYNKISIPSLKMPNGKYILESKQIQLMPGLRNLVSLNLLQPNKSNKATLFGFPNYDMDLGKLYPAANKNAVVKENITSRDLTRGYSLSELPGTKIEIEKVYDILFPLGLEVKKYLGEEALESKIKSLKDPKILHIATHGYFLSNADLIEDSTGITYNTEKSLENPLLRSGLLLSGANHTLNYSGKITNNEDGILTAYEAMALDLSNTELVILSACETGLGEEMNGEGVFGLQRAFQLAGARNILMSLWKVSDAGTQELMTLFYKNWALTKNAPLAFRQAQLELMKKYPSPYYWAAFVCVGY